jgi:nitrite reductase/ring-hydroxylating ferredoxin subunit
MSSTELDLTRVLCSLADLKATGCRGFKVGPGEWPMKGFVVQVSDGARAYVNRCPHVAYPLNYAPDMFLTFDDSMIQCYVHGAIFEKDTGYCIAGPCAGLKLVPVPVEIVEGYVLLDAGADPADLAKRYG